MINKAHDFFAAQRYYTHMSRLYYGLFMVVAVVQFVILFLVLAGLVYAFTGVIGSFVWLWVIFLLAGYFGLGFFFAKKRLEQGGISIAKSLNAVRLFVYQDNARHAPIFNRQHIRVGDSRDLPDGYRRYYEFATQMSIASGVPMPQLYVLPFEKGVNGFVAGFEPNDTVMVLTQGAVDELSNAELYGLIGHEFGHILHGDARLNLRLYVLLSALAWMYRWVEEQDDKTQTALNPYSHGRAMPPSEVMNDKQAWVAYLKYDSKAFKEKYDTRPRHDFWDIPRVPTGKISTAFALAYIVVKLLSIFGMACAEWLKAQFNRQREYLADATSIQLTRNPDVVKALKSLQSRYSSSLYNHSYSTYISHFFFASPKTAEEEIAHTHPKLHERIDALRLGKFDEFSHEMTAHMDTAALDKAHDFAMSYDYQAQNAQSQNSQSQNTQAQSITETTTETKDNTEDGIDYEAVTEKIVNGRLVVENWQLKDEIKKQLLYPKQATYHQAFDGGLIDQHRLKGYELDWRIYRYFNKIVGVVGFFECVLMCYQYRKIDPEIALDIKAVYTPKSLTFNQNHENDKSFFVHYLPRELLSDVACLDRRMDGQMMVRLLLALKKHLKSSLAPQKNLIPQNNTAHQKDSELIKNYSTALIRLIDEPKFYQTSPNLVSTPINELKAGIMARQANNLSNFLSAAAWLAMTNVLLASNAAGHNAAVFVGLCQSRSQEIFKHLALPALWQDKSGDSVVLVLLAFLVGVQDNSLAIARYDGVISTIVRLLRMAGLADVPNITQDELVTLCHQVQYLTINDWLVILGGLDGVDNAPLFGAIETAMVFDGQFAQVEYDSLCLLALAWGRALPSAMI